MAPWEFHNPVRIQFGCGVRRELRTVLGIRRGTLLVVTTPAGRRRFAETIDLLADLDPVIVDDVAPNPDIGDIDSKLAQLGPLGIGEVVGIGGGSALDTAKVLAACLSEPCGSVARYLIEGAPVPTARGVALVCLPTTAGTGSEVTPFATVWDHKAGKKHSLAGEAVRPDLALLDPEITLSVPPDVTAMTGLDAITQAFESIWSRKANPVANAHAVRAIRIGMETLPRLCEQPADTELRARMLEASLLAGLAISSTRTALCHSMSYALTLHLGIPHGLACGFTLPEVFAFNCGVDPARFARLAESLGFASAEKLRDRVSALLAELRVGGMLRRFAAEPEILARLAPEMLVTGRADNNLRPASVEDVAGILRSAWMARGD